MPSVRVVLVEPKNEGNVGAIARAMKNFGVEDLVLVRPCPLGAEARQRAMHGVDILARARTVHDVAEATADLDLLVATSGIDTDNEKKFARIAIPPRELAAKVAAFTGRVGILLGREDFGLRDEEIRACDLLVTIPASRGYPILNVSHAAAILLYELHAVHGPDTKSRSASGFEKETLHEAFGALMASTDYPAHKSARTKVMFRRLIGRAIPTKWEFHALIGVLQRATNRIKRLERDR